MIAHRSDTHKKKIKPTMNAVETVIDLEEADPIVVAPSPAKESTTFSPANESTTFSPAKESTTFNLAKESTTLSLAKESSTFIPVKESATFSPAKEPATFSLMEQDEDDDFQRDLMNAINESLGSLDQALDPVIFD